jgi:hypothetical protein
MVRLQGHLTSQNDPLSTFRISAWTLYAVRPHERIVLAAGGALLSSLSCPFNESYRQWKIGGRN